MAMEGFNELIHKLREAHEREVEGWQENMQELTHKKGCDTKRMEELYSKNQLLREQQRLLTENIKQLENRLRAGLCDRCTVTQDVAKTAQIQSLQRFSNLAMEMNTLKKENQRLREEVKSLRGALEGQSGHSPQDTPMVVRLSPDRLPPVLITPLIAPACRSSSQPPEGATVVKTEPGQGRSRGPEETLSDRKQLKTWNGRSYFDSYKPLAMTSPLPAVRRTPHSPARGEKRAQSVETVGQRPSPVSPTMPSHLLLLRNSLSSLSSSSSPSSSSSSSLPGDDKTSRHLVHTPVPYRPRPMKNSSLSLPWHLSEPNLPRFPNLLPTHSQQHLPQQGNQGCQGKEATQGRRQGSAQAWAQCSPPPQPSRLPLSQLLPLYQPIPQPMPQPLPLALRRSLSAEHEERESPIKKVAPPLRREAGVQSQPERLSGEGLRGAPMDGPLDLSDTGRSKSSQSQQDSKHRPILQEGKTEAETDSFLQNPDCPSSSSSSSSSSSTPSSSSPHARPSSSSSSSTPPSSEQREQRPNNHTSQPQEEEQAEREEDEERGDHTSKDRKVPVLTISLRPVVLLETLNCGLLKQDSTNGKDSLSTDPGSSLEDHDGESILAAKRRRTGLGAETETETEAVHQREEGDPR